MGMRQEPKQETVASLQPRIEMEEEVLKDALNNCSTDEFRSISDTTIRTIAEDNVRKRLKGEH